LKEKGWEYLVASESTHELLTTDSFSTSLVVYCIDILISTIS
jgi:hypothetical protein